MAKSQKEFEKELERLINKYKKSITNDEMNESLEYYSTKVIE